MSSRHYRLEFERTLVRDTFVSEQTGLEHAVLRPQWFWRFVATNGRELARSSETYKRRVDAITSAEATTGCYAIRDLEDEGACWREVRGTPEIIKVRWLR